ncbi:ANTAR domain-containing protein [Mycobacterium sp. ITM-2016-00317]|uniref:ANTAR domain-containing protein n=1 Tax=Mycobacterium sp. ITM-2016-00317 TaxID=2099694 RepID=UPI00287FC973|nr:ANTAR domain-containing protein [Mycobacterium sp. ITM-2016-00317]WNG88069.1 ANTAR domain-containing protein [Mycobacterium sp. ITM-2016-00317]
MAYATDTIAVQLDELQFTLGEGPCLDAYLYDEPQIHPNLDSISHTSRWPTFATEATQLGVHSLFAFPVPGALGPSRVLELYRRAPGSLTQDQHAAARACASAIGQRLQTNWDKHLASFGGVREAIDAVAGGSDAVAGGSAVQDGIGEPFTRTQIHVAAGMLAIQLNTEPDEALDRLRAYAYAYGRRISSVAADIIAHRLTLHDQPGPPHQ